MAIRCNNCWTKVIDLGQDQNYGGQLIQCPDCGKMWSMGQSMTGPEYHFMSLDENGEFDDNYSSSGNPIDTLDPNCCFYLSLVILIFGFGISKWLGL